MSGVKLAMAGGASSVMLSARFAELLPLALLAVSVMLKFPTAFAVPEITPVF